MSEKLHFLLIHGSWHGGWIWNELKKNLIEKGFDVSCPSLTGLGERKHLLSKNITIDTFIQDIENHISFYDLENIILVGHSFAGSIISGIADRMKNKIKLLIYFDSLILFNGETPFDTLPKKTVQERINLSQQFDNGISIPAPSPEKFGILDIKQSIYLKSKLTPMPLSAYMSKLNLKNKIGNDLPVCYLNCINPEYESFEIHKERVSELGWSVYNLNAGHDAMLSNPHETINLFYKILSIELKKDIKK